MKTTVNKHKVWQLLLSLVVVASTLLWVGCKEESEELIPGTNKPLAVPKDFSSKVRGTTVELAWRGNAETKAYEVVYSCEGSEEVSLTAATTNVTIEALKIQTAYAARVRAVAENEQYSSDWATHRFTTGNENILKATPKELSDTLMVVLWTADAAVTHLVVYPQANPDAAQSLDISPVEKATGEKRLAGLNPETTYEVELYNGSNLRGSAAYTTMPRVYPALSVAFSDTTPVSITLSWAAGEALTHFVLSPASLAGVTQLSVADGETSLALDNLAPNTQYTLAAWANNSPRGSSSFATKALAACTLTAAPAPTSVTVGWTPADSYVDRITYGSSTYTLTDDDVAEGKATIINLQPLTPYTFKLQVSIGGVTYDRGEVTTITREPPRPKARYMPSDGSGSIRDSMVVCLSGDTIMLAEGKSYEWEADSYAWPVDRSVTIMGTSAVNRSIISVTGGASACIKLPASVDSIVFRQLNIVHATGASAGTYFINQAAADACDVKKLIFDGCNISGLGRSILRLQASASPSNQKVGTLVVNNTVVTDCGTQSGQNYAFIQCTTYGLVDNIWLTNSTFSNVSKTTNFISGSNSTQVFQNIAINGCTFYNVIGTGGRHFIDGGTSASTNVAVTIQNTILGKVVDISLATNRGTRGCTVTTTNTYQTTDWVTTASATQLDIPNTTPYAGSAADLFTDPDNGDFHFKDVNFAGAATAGDPRWR